MTFKLILAREAGVSCEYIWGMQSSRPLKTSVAGGETVAGDERLAGPDHGLRLSGTDCVSDSSV